MVSSGVHQEQEPFSLESEGTPYHKNRYRWVMLVLVWICYLIFGLVAFALAPLVTPIIEDLNISYSQMGFVLGAWPLSYVVVAAIGGVVVDRLGIRKSIFLGVLLIGLSAGLRYLAGGFGTLFLCVALFGVGGPMISIGAPKTISLWFPWQRAWDGGRLLYDRYLDWRRRHLVHGKQCYHAPNRL